MRGLDCWQKPNERGPGGALSVGWGASAPEWWSSAVVDWKLSGWVGRHQSTGRLLLSLAIFAREHEEATKREVTRGYICS